jgi:hypothetical protein
MKTTVDIPDALMRRCRRATMDRHVTFKELVEEGLTRVLGEQRSRRPFRLKAVKFGGGGFQAGFDETSWDRIRDAAYEGRV